MTKPKPITLSIKATDLRDLLTTVLPFADKDQIPLLQTVHLAGHGSCVTATATNRFILGMQRVDIQAPTTLDAIVPTKAAKEILALYKPGRRAPFDLRLSFTPDLVTIEAPGVPDMPSATWALGSGTYPKVSGLIKDLDERPGDYVPTIDPRWLRVISGLPGPLHIIPGARNKRVTVRNDDGFIGAVMPIRTDFDHRDMTEWADMLGTKEKTA